MVQRFLLFAVIASAVSLAQAADDIATLARDVVDGESYQGIDFAMAPKTAREILPQAFLNGLHPGSHQGIDTYEFRDDPAFDCVLLRFKDDSLIEIDLIYFPSRVANHGGINALKQNAIDVLGEPATRTKETLLWDFPRHNRMIVGFDVSGKWSLHVYDRARRRAIDNYHDTTVAPDHSRLQVFVGPSMPATTPVSDTIALAIGRTTVRESQSATVQSSEPDYRHGTLRRQTRAYNNLHNYDRPLEMRERVFEFIVKRIERDHPNDYTTQLYVLDRQMAAFEELRDMSTPEGMATSHFTQFKSDAAQWWPYDYSVQLFVLKSNIDKYLMHRLSGVGGDEIVEMLLRD